MYEVEIRVYDRYPTAKLASFFDQTKQFGKKFYHIDHSDARVKPRLGITALAVSRDVTYILRWDITCEQLLTEEADDDGVMIEDMIDEKFPAWGLRPRDYESLGCYFPNAGRDNYTDTFKLHGFIEVQKLLKDGIIIAS